MDSGDKATNKAMSAAYKYAAMQAFCIPTEGDNDADATTHEVKHERTANANAAKGLPAAPITPTDGALDALKPDRREYCTQVASSVIDRFEAGQPQEGFKAYNEVKDPDERVAVWESLKGHSAIRREIKKIGDALKKQQMDPATQP